MAVFLAAWGRDILARSTDHLPLAVIRRKGMAFKCVTCACPAVSSRPTLTRAVVLRDIVNREFAKLEADPAPLETMDSFYQQAYEMISSPAVRDAFDLTKESESLKKRYGFGRFLENGTYGQPYGAQAGMRMLLARRLVEAGARFVSLTFGGWDDHTRIRESYEKQMPPLDNALATLIRDLDDPWNARQHIDLGGKRIWPHAQDQRVGWARPLVARVLYCACWRWTETRHVLR